MNQSSSGRQQNVRDCSFSLARERERALAWADRKGRYTSLSRLVVSPRLRRALRAIMLRPSISAENAIAA